MSVLIKGMKMPKTCDECALLAEENYYCECFINEQYIPWEWKDGCGAEIIHMKPDWCPLTEVPTPHGRLIDADALILDKRIDTFSAVFGVAEAPTVIEAEDGE